MRKSDGGKKAKADSLMNEAARKREFSKTQSKIANAQIKKGTGEQVRVINIKGETTPTAKERLKIASNKERSAMVDEYQAKKLTSATRAKSPSSTPKPRISKQKSAPTDSASYYKKLAKAQMDSSNEMGMKNNPMGKDVLKRSLKNTEKAIKAARKPKK